SGAKNSTSVARNAHKPRRPASRRSSALSNWLVVIRAAADARLLFEVVLWRWRTRLPLEAARAPGVCARASAAEDRPAQIAERQQVTHGEHRRARGGKDVEQRELRRVFVVAPRHAEPAEQVLREEGEVEAEEDGERGDAREDLGVHAPGDLWPPEVNAAEVGQ